MEKKTEDKLPLVSVKKSNGLIQSIGKPTLLASKVLLAALLNVKEKSGCSEEEKKYYTNLENKTGVDFSKGLIAEITNSELRRSMGSGAGSYYKEIKKLLDSSSKDSLARQCGIFIADPESRIYGFTFVVSSAFYDGNNGKMFIKFSNEQKIRDQIINLKKNYTLLNFNLMMRFKSTYSYRIYEMVTSEIGLADYRNGKIKEDEYSFQMGVSELKYKLGILDPYISTDVRAAISQAQTAADFEKIEKELAKENKMPRFVDLKRYALEVAKKEINSLTNAEFSIDYEPIRGGRGGKVIAVDFLIKRLKKKRVEDNKNGEALIEEITTVQSFIEEQLTATEIREILDIANHDIDKIRKAYQIATESTTEIKNLVGFLKKAIQNEYKVGTKKKKKNAFNNFDQTEVDYEAIAQKKIRERLQYDFKVDEGVI